jgi:Fe2+ or Zn2+ uptake regulation protein
VNTTHCHPSAYVIFKEVRKVLAKISLSTVYYSLNEFAKHGIINILEFDSMENRLEGNTETHIHLICKKCHNIMDFHSVLFDTKDIEKKTGFSVTETRFEYHGYCHRCRDNDHAVLPDEGA